MEATEAPPKRRRRAPNIKHEIERRAQGAIKLAELESQKVALAEMVVERLDEIIALLRGAGFKVATVKATAVAAANPAPVASQAVAAAPVATVKNPCEGTPLSGRCGAESGYWKDLSGGAKRYLCKKHAVEQQAIDAEEATTKSLMGNTGTNFTRPTAAHAPVEKTVIQADGDGGFSANGAAVPPANSVLD